MNIVYGAIAIVISLYVSKVFVKQGVSPTQIFLKTFAFETLLVLILGYAFYFAKLGFFSYPMGQVDAAIRIIGFALFLALLVAMKALNEAKKNN